MPGSGKGRSSGRRKFHLTVGVLAAAALSLLVVTPVVGDGLNSSPAPAPRVIAATSPATSLQVAGAQGMSGASVAAAKKKKKSKQVLRRISINSRITSHEILTEEGKGTFVGIKCPNGAKAISGGVLSRYINLLVSSSAPNHPLTRKYTPRIWWLTVTNVNVDGNGGTLPWQGVVNCLSPVRLAD